MAYSRWLESDWYIYWKASNSFNKNDQELVIWKAGLDNYDITFKYPELKKMIRRGSIKKHINNIELEDDLKLIKKCIKQFISNVEDQCK